MLRKEEAEKRLEKLRSKDWQARRSADLGKLPAKLATLGRALLGRQPDGKVVRDWEKAEGARRQAADELDALPEKQRQRVFAAFFPQLAGPMEAAWQLTVHLPYEADSYRKAFRAPGDRSVSQPVRRCWLANLLGDLEGLDPDVAWVAAWAPYLGQYGGAESLGLLLAGALERGGAEGDAVFEILCDSARGEHEIGAMGRHVTRAFLASSRPDGWEFVEKLLLAAQRQEGLRQVILESVDEARPEAFRRMLRLILDRDLLRFSATVRAVDVWLGLGYDSTSARVLKGILEKLLAFLEDRRAREKALGDRDPETVALALWSAGFEDAVAALPLAQRLLAEQEVERRYIGLFFLQQADLPGSKKALAALIDDPDPAIALRAAAGLDCDEFMGPSVPDQFERFERLLARLPQKKVELPALVWPWTGLTVNREDLVSQLVNLRGKRPAKRLLPYLKDLGPWEKIEVLEQLAQGKKWDTAVRETLFGLVGDGSSWVRERALELLKKCEPTEAEARTLEGLLTRKNGDVRRGVLTVLQKQKADAVLASADRLLAAGKPEQRLGGLELLRQQCEKKRAPAACRQRAEDYRARRKSLSADEQTQLEAILDAGRPALTFDDALGLMDPARRTPPTEPKARKGAFLSRAALECLKSLDALLKEHEDDVVQVPPDGFDDEPAAEEVLGNLHRWRWPYPDPRKLVEEDAQRLPLRDLWEKWYAERPASQRDRDGLELLRAYAWRDLSPGEWRGYQRRYGKDWGEFLKWASGGLEPGKLKRADVVSILLSWLLHLHPPEGASDYLLDAAETACALVPEKARKRVVNLDDWSSRNRDWRVDSPAEAVVNLPREFWALRPDQRTEAHRLRYWQLLHWRDQPAPGVGRLRPDLEYLLAAFRAGAAGEADVYDHLLGPSPELGDLERLTQHGDVRDFREVPALRPLVERCRDRVLEIELARGENPTVATEAALQLGALVGLDTLLRLLAAIAGKPFARRYTSGTLTRLDVLTRLVRITHPGPADTPEEFAARTAQAGLPDERLLELAFLAPQWVRHVEHTLGWAGLAEGVWWFLAHMDIDLSDEEDLDLDDLEDEDGAPAGADGEAGQDSGDWWQKLVRERTPLTRAERREGAVDVTWFHRTWEAVGKKHWEALAGAAKYGCRDQSYRKPLLLADVLRGKAKKSDLVQGIRQKRLRESVRLLGLLPLPDGNRRDAELLDRYKVLLEYRRYARGLSALSKEGAVRTAEIGMENLARTAGYPDPVRLEWAMEAHEIADLARGPISATHQGVTVTLALDAQAQPQLTVARGDKPLKNVPADVRKHPKIAALVERRADLRRQASRVRQSLELAMCRGDAFTGAELVQLFAHPLLAPLLERLVLVGEGILGYPVSGGQGLRDHAGKVEPVKKDEKLRLAHPYDLLHTRAWHLWQHDLFAREQVQPFKQVFRELYVVTEQEKADGTVSHRYAGQQVNPGQATALFGSRNWSTQDGISRTFHDAGLTAEVSLRWGGGTPLEVEGWTIEGVSFRRRGEWKPLPLVEVPPLIFSEAMRDLDLVVSVAHRGGVDPEASASTVEMRAALLRETCALLNVENYRIEKSHVFIDGRLGKYSIHLGSGSVHRLPGGSLCIVPVHAQHRGRLFLPFADDDPRTAEVLSKVLLLARDHEIQDPNLLDQLR